MRDATAFFAILRLQKRFIRHPFKLDALPDEFGVGDVPYVPSEPRGKNEAASEPKKG